MITLSCAYFYKDGVFFSTEAINYVKLNQMIKLIKNVTINLADLMTLKLNSKTVLYLFVF